MTNDKENDPVTRRAREIHPKGETGHYPGGAAETRIAPRARPDAGQGAGGHSTEQTIIHSPGAVTTVHRGSSASAQADTHDRVTGWLVAISGPGKGKARPIFEGKNSVGRDPDQRIPLDFNDSEISRREHFFVTYEPKKREFLINDGVKTNLVYLRGEVVLGGAQKLTAGDEIEVGNTKLRFVPLCGPDFSWDDT
jgi:FHA domain